MNIQTVSGRTFAYDDAGVGQPTLVLIHAFPLSREMWKPQVETLSPEFRVLAPDLPGFGGTAGFSDNPSVDRMAEAVAEFLDALSLTEPIVLAGLSMGGYVALAFARKHRDRLRGLILADTRAEPDDAAAQANRDKMIAFAKDHSALDVIDQMLPKMVSDETRSQRPKVVDEVRRIAAAQPIGGIINALPALRDRPDARSDLADIAVPTLVIVGAEDALTPPALSKELAVRLRAVLEIVPGAGHLSNLEKPAEFTAAVRRFLQGLG
ncbi:MAG TPA: alpha/beta fold hydrolase [Gemmataceae bacterium]|jgi:pimeloyl-ACP methyl ester carboxylesterase|nr:alpha/beta fold hydrolase [Gemmataceae bacterium]